MNPKAYLEREPGDADREGYTLDIAMRASSFGGRASTNHPGKDPAMNEETRTEVLKIAALKVGQRIPCTGDGPAEAAEDVRNAVRGAMGSRDLVLGTKAIVLAILRGGAQTGEAALKTLSETSRTVVRETADLHGDVGLSTKGLVLGAIASAKGAAVERPLAASTAAQAAVDEAAAISWAAETRVRGALKASIGGMQVSIRDARSV